MYGSLLRAIRVWTLDPHVCHQALLRRSYKMLPFATGTESLWYSTLQWNISSSPCSIDDLQRHTWGLLGVSRFQAFPCTLNHTWRISKKNESPPSMIELIVVDYLYLLILCGDARYWIDSFTHSHHSHTIVGSKPWWDVVDFFIVRSPWAVLDGLHSHW